MKNLPFITKIIFFNFIVFYTIVFFSWLSYEHDFSLIYTNMSRLGRPSYNADWYWLYTTASILAAGLLIPYYWAFRKFRTQDRLLNLAVLLLMGLGFTSIVGLVGLAIFNADHYLGHKIFGGIYFFSDILIMALTVFIVLKHPKLDKGIIIVAVASLIFNMMFLESNGKLSWSEWSTVFLSWITACWLSINYIRIQAAQKSVPVQGTDPGQPGLNVA